MSLAPRIDKIDKNFLINGNFDFWQRTTSQVQITTNRAYAADRWMVWPSTTSTTAANVVRATSTNPGSQYDMNFGPWSFNQKCAAGQIVEFLNTLPLRGKEVTFSFNIKSGGTSPIRAEILSWTGTANSVTAFNNAVPYTNWTTYTLAANFSSIATTNVTSTTSYQKVVLSGTVPANCNNIICVIAYDQDGGQQQYVSQAQLVLGNISDPEFARAGKTIGEELQLCQRYYATARCYSEAFCNSAGFERFKYPIQLPVTMRATPSMITFQNGLSNIRSPGATYAYFDVMDTNTIYVSFESVGGSANYQYAVDMTYRADAEL